MRLVELVAELSVMMAQGKHLIEDGGEDWHRIGVLTNGIGQIFQEGGDEAPDAEKKLLELFMEKKSGSRIRIIALDYLLHSGGIRSEETDKILEASRKESGYTEFFIDGRSLH